MKYFATYILLLLVFTGCHRTNDPQTIVDNSIRFHGEEHYEHFTAEFDFRGRHYVLERDNGRFRYHRIFTDTTGEVHDILSNDGFVRRINGEETDLTDEWKRRYSNSVNSVAYFALLPFGLNDPAVKKRYLGTFNIEGTTYHKIEVTFNRQGGGEDYDDVFVYWFDKEDYSMDYFAYNYQTEGGGARFRKAVDQERVNGILFSSYINYKPVEDTREVAIFDSLYVSGELLELSHIEKNNLQVTTNQ